MDIRIIVLKVSLFSIFLLLINIKFFRIVNSYEFINFYCLSFSVLINILSFFLKYSVLFLSNYDIKLFRNFEFEFPTISYRFILSLIRFINVYNQFQNFTEFMNFLKVNKSQENIAFLLTTDKFSRKNIGHDSRKCNVCCLNHPYDSNIFLTSHEHHWTLLT